MRKWHYFVIIIFLMLLASVLLTGNTALAQVPPTVDTNPAGNVTSISATLNGNLTSLGDASTVSVSFEWGLDTSYGNETTPGNLSAPAEFSADLSGLNPGTTYHFRAKAVGDGNATGLDMTFTTGTSPMVTTNPAGNVTSDSATLNGDLTSPGNASVVSVSFEWGLDTSYGNETTPGNLSAPGVFSADLSSLSPGTTYHFRAKAVGDGNATGSDMTFITALAFNLEGWGWCTDYNTVVPVTFDGYATMVERTGAANSYSMHAVGNLTLPAPYNEIIPLDMYGSRVRSVFYLRQEVTGLSVSFDGAWLSGNETYIAMGGAIALPNPSGTSLKTAKICSVFLRTPGGQVPLTEPGTFVQDLDSMLSRMVKFVDSVVTALIGTGFSSILSSILAKLAVLVANLRGLGIPYIP